MSAIFKREFKSFFTSPIGYVILAVFMFFEGLYFGYMYYQGYADVTFVFDQSFTIILFVIPIITMRLFSEERRQKTDQALLTAPVSITSIVLGKYFAALCLFMLAFLPTFIFQIIVSLYVDIGWLIYIGNVVGLLLFGGSIIAIGTFVSSLTENQIVAAVGSFAISLSILMLDSIGGVLNSKWVTVVVESISFSERYNTFVNGIFDYSNAIFFLSFIALFVFLTIKAIEKRRYS